MEIERKFLVKSLPENLEQYPKHHIQQAYISTNPVLRLRQWDETYILTYKGPGLLSREEHEFPLTEEAYGRLLTKTEGTPITKDRYCIPCGTYTVELDVFAPPFAPLMLAEVALRFCSSSQRCSSSLAPQNISPISSPRGRSRPVKRSTRLWCTRRKAGPEAEASSCRS